ncbi:hypothetical protein F4806DRAFT_467587 [Annulohypoxylon nitens]|nr:hypothetical protein F4806DRAFT_467587 [Annulohypoxylon nitens]
MTLGWLLEYASSSCIPSEPTAYPTSRILAHATDIICLKGAYSRFTLQTTTALWYTAYSLVLTTFYSRTRTHTSLELVMYISSTTYSFIIGCCVLLTHFYQS